MSVLARPWDTAHFIPPSSTKPPPEVRPRNHPRSPVPRPTPAQQKSFPRRLASGTIRSWSPNAPFRVRSAVPPDRNNSFDQLAYDAPGNIIAYPHLIDGQPSGGRQAVYDAWNRLVEIKHDNNGETYTLATFEYDGLGRRITKTVDNTDQFDATYHYYYDASGGGQRKVEVRNGSDLVLKQQVWGLPFRGYIDELVQVAVNGDPVDDPEFDPDDPDHDPRKYYALQDTQYNVIGLVDDAGDLIERYAYDRYGKRTVYQPVDGTDSWCKSPGSYSARVQVAGQSQPYGLCEVGFQGLWHDEELDIVDNRARVYIPSLGRFAQTDPLGYPDGLNTYAAYHVMWGGVDPTGLAIKIVSNDGTPDDFGKRITSMLKEICPCYDYQLNEETSLVEQTECKTEDDKKKCLDKHLTGCELISGVLALDKTMNIVYTTKTPSAPHGTFTVKMNPDWELKDDKVYFRPPGEDGKYAPGADYLDTLKGDAPTLAHEIIHHAYRAAQGAAAERVTVHTEEGKFRITTKSTPYEEMQTVGSPLYQHARQIRQPDGDDDFVITENSVRREMGLPLRLHYNSIVGRRETK